ncbi:uncharacterized protein LOC117629172 [Prunus dulcis]|uniref:uncharacterized protein LOC117629172 n=1 Tax=Prunus dulcis TaxID=3755 RepID=UPI001482FB55|nr:uncharacterized protein LOC117629172 [Prunus dulcis]
MAALQPGSYAFKSDQNKKYLRYQHEINNLQHVLQFSGEDVASQYAKFQVEEDEQNPGLVHIKSSFNNKYWRRAEASSSWIVAEADKQEREQNQWSCTLFKPEVVQLTPDSGNNTIGVFRLVHKQLGHFIEPFSANGFNSVLYAGRETQPDNRNVFFIVEKLTG